MKNDQKKAKTMLEPSSQVGRANLQILYYEMKDDL